MFLKIIFERRLEPFTKHILYVFDGYQGASAKKSVEMVDGNNWGEIFFHFPGPRQILFFELALI